MTPPSRHEQDEAVRHTHDLRIGAREYGPDGSVAALQVYCVVCDEAGRLASPPSVPAALDGYSTDALVAELRRRNLRLSSADDLLRGLSESEILDFVDAEAVTADEARDYMRRARLSRQSEDA